MSDKDRVRAMIKTAGFEHVEVEDLPAPHRSSGFEEYWNLQSEIAGPLAVMLRELSPDERDRVRETVRGSVEAFQTDEGLTLPGMAIVAAAR